MNLKQGTFYLVIAWSMMLLSGYALNVWLARHFTPIEYGTYGLVMSILLWIEIIVINGIPYALQKFVSSDEENGYSILRTSVRLQLIIAVALFLISVGMASIIASLLKDQQLTSSLRIAFGDILFFGFYHLLVSFQNGFKRFDRQAILIVVYAIGKLAFVILFVSISNSIDYAFMANIAASILGLVTGCFLLKRGVEYHSYDQKELVRFSVPSLLYFLMLMLLFYIDLWAVKRYLNDSVSGYYYSASVIAKIPYYLFLGLSTSLLPILSDQLSKQLIVDAKKSIQQALRFFLILAVPIGFLVSLYSKELIVLLFSSEYEPAGLILSILIWGMTFLAMLFMLTTIINADNRPTVSFILAFGAVVLDVILNVVLVPQFGAIGAALATSIATGASVIAASIYVYLKFRVLLNKFMFFKIGGSMLVVYFFSRCFAISGIGVLLILIFNFIVYLVLLLLLKEIEIKDIKIFLRSKMD